LLQAEKRKTVPPFPLLQIFFIPDLQFRQPVDEIAPLHAVVKEPKRLVRRSRVGISF
jgi:hypothetical protein